MGKRKLMTAALFTLVFVFYGCAADVEKKEEPTEQTAQESSSRQAGEQTTESIAEPGTAKTDADIETSVTQTESGREETTAESALSPSSGNGADAQTEQQAEGTGEAQPEQTRPAAAEPAQTRPMETEPAPTVIIMPEPAQTQPAQTQPAPAETQPEQTSPEPEQLTAPDPVETQPDPVETQPEPQTPAETPAGSEAVAIGESYTCSLCGKEDLPWVCFFNSLDLFGQKSDPGLALCFKCVNEEDIDLKLAEMFLGHIPELSFETVNNYKLGVDGPGAGRVFRQGNSICKMIFSQRTERTMAGGEYEPAYVDNVRNVASMSFTTVVQDAVYIPANRFLIAHPDSRTGYFNIGMAISSEMSVKSGLYYDLSDGKCCYFASNETGNGFGGIGYIPELCFEDGSVADRTKLARSGDKLFYDGREAELAYHAVVHNDKDPSKGCTCGVHYEAMFIDEKLIYEANGTCLYPNVDNGVVVVFK